MTWSTPVPILVFLGLAVLELRPMYATGVSQKHRLMPPPYGGGDIITYVSYVRSHHDSCGIMDELSVSVKAAMLLIRKRLAPSSSSSSNSRFVERITRRL